MKRRRRFCFETGKQRKQRERSAIAAYLKRVMGVQAYYAR